MLKRLTLLFVMAVMYFGAFSQVNNAGSGDENIRKKLAAEYAEFNDFSYESSAAHAVHEMLLKVFKTDLIIPDLKLDNITNAMDRVKIEAVLYTLKSILSNPAPSWETLVELENQKLIRLDKNVTRTSRYTSK